MADEKNFQRLVVSLEGRVDKYEKALAKARGETSRQFDKMGREVSGFEAKLAKVGKSFAGFGKSMVAGFAGGLVAGGLAGIITRLGQMASGVAEVGDQARRAGLSFKSFQELKYVAEQNRIGVDALTDGMKELSLRADEFIETGGGSAAEAFGRLGFTATELAEKLKNPSALLSEIIGKVQGLDQAAQIRIFDELFGGTGGEQFVQLINQGEAGIARTVEEAHALGIVLSDEVIVKAAEVDRKFNQIANTVGSNVKGAIVDATSALLDFINAQEIAATRNRDMATIQDTSNQINAQLQALDDFLAAADRVAPEVAGRIREITTAYLNNEMAAGDAQAALQALAKDDPGVWPVMVGINQIIDLLGLLYDRAGMARAALADVSVASSPMSYAGQDRATPAVTAPSVPPPPARLGSGGGGRSAAISEAERETAAIKNLIAGLEFERSLIGLTAPEQEKLILLRQAGAAATEEQKAQISALVDATYKEQAAADAAADAMQQLGDIGVSAANALVDAFADGKVEASELLTIVTDVLKQLLAMPVGAGGGNWLGGLLGGLFKGGGGGLKLGYNLAGGGRVRGPGTGRSDSIPANLSNGEFVVNARAAGQNLGLLHAINDNRPIGLADGGHVQFSGGIAAMPLQAGVAHVRDGGVSIAVSNTIDARGADIAAVTRLERGLAVMAANFEAKVVGVMKDVKKGRHKV